MVVLDLDLEGAEELALHITRQYPAVAVLGCSSARPAMRVFPPFHGGESYMTALDPDNLLRAVDGLS